MLGQRVVRLADGKEYLLKVDFNALCAFEEATGKSVSALAEEAKKGIGGIREIRGLLYGALRRHHPRVDLDRAGDLVEFESMEALASTLGEIYAEAMPKKRDGDPKAGAPPSAPPTPAP